MTNFRQDNTAGYADKQLDALNVEWENRNNDLGFELGTDEYEFQAKIFADEVAGRTECEHCGKTEGLMETRSGHLFCSYECFEDFFGSEIAEDDDFADVPR